MSKRRTEAVLLHAPPSKRCCRPVCGGSMKLGLMAAPGTGSPPGPPSRKRPHDSGEPDEREAAVRPASGGVPRDSGNFRDRFSSSRAWTTPQKRPGGRDGPTAPQTAGPREGGEADEDCSFNSFQFWRPPLPELDLSLLEDPPCCSNNQEPVQTKGRSSSVAMET
ncbi:uncharacterized protein C9orf40 homolog [Antennarius striatus]|uniref:uncharacterized protein C9orf40 homolog n=1 Tax=Antennarius striatus TaxID=241820 RepID=UPI0035B10C3B